MRLVLLFLFVIGCASAPTTIADFSSPAADQVFSECDVDEIMDDAIQRLPEKQQNDTENKVEHRLVANVTGTEISFQYMPVSTDGDPDTVWIQAGGVAVVYDRQTCKYLRTNVWR